MGGTISSVLGEILSNPAVVRFVSGLVTKLIAGPSNPAPMPAITERNPEDLRKEAQRQLGIDSVNAYNFAFAGNSGTGKSSLVNALRGVSDDDPNAAGVNEMECTAKITKYTHPEHEHIVFWDMPGGATPRHAGATYFLDQKLYAFDTIIIVVAGRFTELDIALSQGAKEFNVDTNSVASTYEEHNCFTYVDATLLKLFLEVFPLKDPVKMISALYRISCDNDYYTLKTLTEDKWSHCPFWSDIARNLPEQRRKVDSEQYAAKVDEKECTTDITKFPHPTASHVVLWDIPGAHTKAHPSDTYFMDKKLFAFDMIIITGAKRFTDVDLAIARDAKKYNTPMVFVRSKSDEDINNRSYRKKAPKEEVKYDFQQEAVKNILDQLPENLKDRKIFVISSHVIRGGLDPEEYALDEENLINYVAEVAENRRTTTTQRAGFVNTRRFMRIGKKEEIKKLNAQIYELENKLDCRKEEYLLLKKQHEKLQASSDAQMHELENKLDHRKEEYLSLKQQHEELQARSNANETGRQEENEDELQQVIQASLISYKNEKEENDSSVVQAIQESLLTYSARETRQL